VLRDGQRGGDLGELLPGPVVEIAGWLNPAADGG
jgi:hypothetical protein